MSTTTGRVTRYRTWLGHRPIGRVFRPAPASEAPVQPVPDEDDVERPDLAPVTEQP